MNDENKDIAVWDEKKNAILASYVPQGSHEHEIDMFFELGRRLGANPFLREIYMTSYGTGSGRRISIFCGRDFYRRRGQQEPDYRGIHVEAHYSNDKLVMLNGTPVHEYDCSQDRGKLLGAYCLIWRDGHARPAYVYAKFAEFCQLKDGRPMALWASKPEVMIKKCAESLCWRLAYQGLFRGTYDESEKWFDDSRKETDITPRNEITMEEIAEEIPLSREEIDGHSAPERPDDIIGYIEKAAKNATWADIMGAGSGIFGRLVESAPELSESQRNLGFGTLFARLCAIAGAREEWKPGAAMECVTYLDALLNDKIKQHMNNKAFYYQREALENLAIAIGIDINDVREARHVKARQAQEMEQIGVINSIKEKNNA